MLPSTIIDSNFSAHSDVKRITDRKEDNSQALTRRGSIRAASRERSPSPALSSIESIDDPLAGLGPEPVVPPGGIANTIEAEKAFIYLLKKFRVDETWTWDVTIRKIIVDPLYKSLKTLAERKAVWQKVSSFEGVDEDAWLTVAASTSRISSPMRKQRDKKR